MSSIELDCAVQYLQNFLDKSRKIFMNVEMLKLSKLEEIFKCFEPVQDDERTTMRLKLSLEINKRFQMLASDIFALLKVLFDRICYLLWHLYILPVNQEERSSWDPLENGKSQQRNAMLAIAEVCFHSFVIAFI